MAYTDFSAGTVLSDLGITTSVDELFGVLAPLVVPAWLPDLLLRGRRQVLSSEKARSEFIVAPVLLAVQEVAGSQVSIYSGQRLDVDAARGLTGECDFILAAGPPVPGLTSPLLLVVEAKRNEVESGIWQCVAQMFAATLFNTQTGHPRPAVYGCVTNGEVWQFLRLHETNAVLDRQRYFINDVGSILAIFRQITTQ